MKDDLSNKALGISDDYIKRAEESVFDIAQNNEITEFQKVLATQIIEKYIKVKAVEYAAFLREMEVERATRLNEYASNDKLDKRWLMSIPENLAIALETTIPDWNWNKKQGRWFAKTFNKFSPAEKV